MSQWITKCAAVFTLLFVATRAAESSKTRAPHIIVILVDDVGWADVNLTSRPGVMPTPNIQDLCAKGITFNQYYTQSTCTPARASLMVLDAMCTSFVHYSSCIVFPYWRISGHHCINACPDRALRRQHRPHICHAPWRHFRVTTLDLMHVHITFWLLLSQAPRRHANLA